jgi:hypothetical protein
MMESEEIRTYVKGLGLPSGDSYELPTSGKTFPDGAHFRTEELPQTVEQYERMFSFADEHVSSSWVPVHPRALLT